MNELENDIVERLTYTLLASKEYKRAYEQEKKAYMRLVKRLTKKQAKALDEYFNATAETTAITEKLAYKQGIADLINLLGKNDGEVQIIKHFSLNHIIIDDELEERLDKLVERYKMINGWGAKEMLEFAVNAIPLTKVYLDFLESKADELEN